MSNGSKRVVLNSRERVISSDFNRLQEIVASNVAERLQRMHNDNRPFERPGFATVFVGSTTGNTPLRADVYGGLFVEVDDPASLFVTPGTVGIMKKDSPQGVDDIDYKVINDPGVPTSGILEFTANAGPGLRVDVVECAMTTSVLETDSRDIFDPSTGLFTPGLVNKVVQSSLTYRIRTGAQGAGYPGHAQGWLPLAVCVVPQAATGFDGCHFYDVRPLVTERAPYDGNLRHPMLMSNVVLDEQTSPTSSTARWVFRGTALTTFDGYLAGGVITKGAGGFGSGQETFANQDVEWVDAVDVDNRKNGWGNGFDGWVYLAALFPEDLPRWARYSVIAIDGKRKPLGARGVLCLLRGLAADTDGSIGRDRHVSSGVLPANTGLVGTADGVILAASWGDTASASEALMPMFQHGNRVRVPKFTQGAADPLALTLEATPPADSQWVSLTGAQTNHLIPPYAKVAEFSLALTYDAGGTPAELDYDFRVQVGTTADIDRFFVRSFKGPFRIEAAGTMDFEFSDVMIPLLVTEDRLAIGANQPVMLTVEAVSVGDITSLTARCLGFEF